MILYYDTWYYDIDYRWTEKIKHLSASAMIVTKGV